MMAGVFVVGAGVGLAAAWWLHKPPPGTPVSSVRAMPAAPSAEGKRSATIRGISPSELPYDGAPPPAVQSSPEPVASQVPAVPAMSSGTSTVDTVGQRNAGAGDLEPDAQVVTPPAAQTPPMPQADDEPKTAKAATRQGNASVTNAAPKRKSVTRTDREIERIRRQVDEELKKKTEHGRAPNSIARVSATRASLARCDRQSNFIRREMCRWQVCNGSWGRNGCPSYQQQASTY